MEILEKICKAPPNHQSEMYLCYWHLGLRSKFLRDAREGAVIGAPGKAGARRDAEVAAQTRRDTPGEGGGGAEVSSCVNLGHPKVS